ncbi:MAG: DUF354 domain-containing protein, partial [Candidatus Bathyarchaeia archaeon]
QILPFVDLVVGSGGTICRESALMGIPTINFHFWDAIAKYLYKKKFPIKHIASTKKIVKASKMILKNRESYRMDTEDMLKELESPVPITIRHIESSSKLRR